MILVAFLLSIPTYLLPLWKLTLFTPEHPAGMRLNIYSYKLTGGNGAPDLEAINALNHDIGMKELYLKHRNASVMDFIVGVEIYDHLEKVADRFDDVANEINSIVIEQV